MWYRLRVHCFGDYALDNPWLSDLSRDATASDIIGDDSGITSHVDDRKERGSQKRFPGMSWTRRVTDGFLPGSTPCRPRQCQLPTEKYAPASLCRRRYSRHRAGHAMRSRYRLIETFCGKFPQRQLRRSSKFSLFRSCHRCPGVRVYPAVGEVPDDVSMSQRTLMAVR